MPRATTGATRRADGHAHVHTHTRTHSAVLRAAEGPVCWAQGGVVGWGACVGARWPAASTRAAEEAAPESTVLEVLLHRSLELVIAKPPGYVMISS